MEIQSEFLEKCIGEHKIFIDTSSFLHEGAEKFFQNILPILERERKSLIVPLSVCNELEKLANDADYCAKKYPANNELNAKARRACETINRFNRAGLIEIYADPDDGDFADNVFLHVFTKKRMQYNLLLITQDKGLASEIINLGKDNRAVHGVKKILVQCLDENGLLKRIFTPQAEKASEEIPLGERFATTNEVVQIEGQISVSEIPCAGDYVTAVRGDLKKQFCLSEELGKGGEGTIYKTELDGFVAKIYKPEKITRLRYEKLKLMLTKNIDCEGVCFPRAMIYNRRDDFVGYLMKTACGRELGKSVFMPMPFRKYFPHWNKIDTVQLCVTILQKFKYLHDRNIILGDINPFNILVVSPTEVYFVDTDSYQVEGFICPVGMPLFTPPELQGKQYGLRTLGNENFAVATLLFMIMLPGKPPYAMQDGAGIVENIIKGDFAYPFLNRKTGKVPTGQWRYCWSHLTYRIKEAFYQTFRFDGTRHAENNRPNVSHWLKLFESYLYSLKSGKMSDWDEESLLIFPTRWKKDKNKTYTKCKICEREFEEERLQEGICRDCRENFQKCKLCGKIFDEAQLEEGICQSCLNKGEHYRCERCGREMIYTNRRKYIEKIPRPSICSKHFKTCKICGKKFDEHFLERGICSTCLKLEQRPKTEIRSKKKSAQDLLIDKLLDDIFKGK